MVREMQDECSAGEMRLNSENSEDDTNGFNLKAVFRVAKISG